jgi:hypothetical protein
MGQCGLDSSGSKQRQVVGCCEHGDEPLSYIKCGKILQLSEDLLAFEEDLCFMGFQSTKHIVFCNS